jgi:hypothetical protein
MTSQYQYTDTKLYKQSKTTVWFQYISIPLIHKKSCTMNRKEKRKEKKRKNGLSLSADWTFRQKVYRITLRGAFKF